MNFNRHSELIGKHAFLSPSSSAWLNYDEQKLEARYHTRRSALRGTDLHALAHEAIRLGVALEASQGAIAAYVDDALEYGLVCEQHLFYSENCFGSADTIGFRDGLLRISDLKTGIVATTFRQLHVYDALFCLEYHVDPFEIGHELRIYQRDEIRIDNPDPSLIDSIMEKIVHFDNQIEQFKED